MSSQNPTTAHNFQDLSGKRFGQLQVTSRDRRGGKKAFWLCKCDCGEDYVAQSYYLTSGARTDCGCRRIEKSKDARKNTTMGTSNLSPLPSVFPMATLLLWTKKTT